MSRRLARAGHVVIAWTARLSSSGACRRAAPVAVVTLENSCEPAVAEDRLADAARRGATDETLARLGVAAVARRHRRRRANAMYKDSQRHASDLGAHGILFVDAGVSGGVWGLENGYGLMVGGEGAAVRADRTRAADACACTGSRLVHCGPAGAGHFTKMVHNGIEYGMMQAYAKGWH